MYDALKSNNGFITVQDIFNRMRKFRPPAGEKYVVKRIPGRDFIQVGVSAFGTDTFKLFQLYAGNRDLYLYLKDMIYQAADQLKEPCEAEEWHAE